LCNVLEHLPDPAGALRTLVDGTRLGTLFVIEVPHFDSLSTAAQLQYQRPVNRHLVPCLHPQLFTKSSLDWLLQRTGLRAQAFWWFGQDVYEWLQLLIAGGALPADSELLRLLAKNLNGLQRVIDQNRQSDCLFCLARRTA